MPNSPTSGSNCPDTHTLVDQHSDQDLNVKHNQPPKHILSYSSSPISSQPPPLPAVTRALLRYQPRVPWLRRIRNRILVFLFFRITRFHIFLTKWFDWRVGLVPKSISIAPQEKVWVDSSKERGRRIEVQVHYPPAGVGVGVAANVDGDSKQRPRRPPPVHINLHGSGFVMPNMEEDREQCAYLARTLGCIVLDSDYCKAPQHKLPAPVHDVLDVIRYVLRNPEKYDVERLTMGGVSAGATTALLAATSPELETLKGVIKHVIAWYPCANLQWRREERVTPPIPKRKTVAADGKEVEVEVMVPGFPLPPWMMDLFMDCAIEEGADLCDPAIALVCVPCEAFPPTTFIVGTHDPLFNDTVQLYHNLVSSARGSDWDWDSDPDPQRKVDVELHVVPDSTHAFERAGLGVDLSKGGSDMQEWAASTKEVWDVVERRLREVYVRSESDADGDV